MLRSEELLAGVRAEAVSDMPISDSSSACLFPKPRRYYPNHSPLVPGGLAATNNDLQIPSGNREKLVMQHLFFLNSYPN